MVFGSFLFVGILESYKNNESLNSAILDSYNTIRTKRSQCQKIHNNLYLAYYPYAGSLRIMKEELERIIDTKGRGLPKEHEIFMQSLNESNTKQLKEIQELSSKKEECYSELYISYEETAILVNLLDEYERIASERAANINGLNPSQKEASNKVNSISADDMLKVFEVGMEAALISNRDKWLSGMEELADFQVEIAKIEENRFSIEATTFGKLRKLYLEAIKNRLNRSFVDYLVQ